MTNKDDKKEIQERMTLLLQVLRTTMTTTGIGIDFDLDNKKLLLVDVKTNSISRVDLVKLNEMFLKGEEPKDEI